MNNTPEKENIFSHLMVESLISSMEDIFIILDTNGCVDYVNDNFYQLLGYDSSEIMGRSLFELFEKSDEDLYTEKAENTELTGRDFIRNYNIGIRSKRGDTVPFNINMTPVASREGKIIGTAVSARDMSKMIKVLKELKVMNETLEKKVQARTQDLQEANRMMKDAEAKLVLSEKMSAMSLLAGGISHEISNPIMAIIGYADQLTYDAVDEAHKKKLEDIKEFAFICMNIISKFCDFAMRSDDEFETICLNSVIEDTLLLAKNKLKYDVDLVKELSKDLPMIKGESNELRHVFINIILNAKDAMPEGGKMVIKTYHDTENVYASIQDSGKGISPGDMKNMFTPFFTTKKEKGTGLGLSVGQEIIKAHGGKISIVSEEGQGTTVTVSVPISKESEK